MKLYTDLNKSYVKLANRFVEFLCSELSVRPSKLSIVSADLRDCIGQCIDFDEDNYVILVKEDGRDIGQVFTTIAHEMVHVRQYMTQELGRLLDEQQHIPYEERWWEKEAYEMAVPLVEKFAKNITSSR